MKLTSHPTRKQLLALERKHFSILPLLNYYHSRDTYALSLYIPDAILKAKVKSVLGLRPLSRLTLVPLFCKLFAGCFDLVAAL